jgi:Asp-tRNA(Asn)/Glu-tRNA(Gln) amidotransferase A subunit family amidase
MASQAVSPSRIKKKRANKSNWFRNTVAVGEARPTEPRISSAITPASTSSRLGVKRLWRLSQNLTPHFDVKPDVYAEARRQVDLVRKEIKTVFQTLDLLVTPTMKTPPATIAASLNAPAPPPATPAPNGGGGNGNPWAFDVYGLPAITLPCGFTSAGLPIGLQISAAPFAETTMLELAHAYEQSTEWHSRRPTIGGAT